MTASGTAGHGAELAAYMDLAALGAVVVKSVSLEPWGGNPAPRLLPLPAATGMLNSVGLQNPGVSAWLSGELPALSRTGASVVASIWGFTSDQFRKAAAAIAQANARRHRGRRGQHLLPQHRGSPADVCPQPRRREGSGLGCRRRPRRRPPAMGQVEPERHRSGRTGRRGGGSRRRCPHAGQHGHGHGDRPRHRATFVWAAEAAACPGRQSTRSRSGPCTSAGPPCPRRR